MQQIIDQASHAIHRASKNMHAIDMDTTSLFGQRSFVSSSLQNSHLYTLRIDSKKAQDILKCLHDPRVAKSRLRPAMNDLRKGMDQCSRKAQEIEDEFNTLLGIAEEVNRAMGHQICKQFCQMERLSVLTVPLASTKDE